MKNFNLHLKEGTTMLSNEKAKFIAKVTIAHIVTYFICGVLAMNLFQYNEQMNNVGLKSVEEINGLAVIFGQLIRGVLFGIVIWWIKDSIIGKKLAWLKLWAILVIIGIISIYEPASASIEGFIYLIPSSEPLPLAFELGSRAEITIQPLLFSLIVTFQRKKKVNIESIV